MGQKIETKNTYEAAYYICRGAKLYSVRTRRLPSNLANKRGYYTQWYMTLIDVPQRAINNFRQGYPMIDVRELASARRRLKRSVNRFISTREIPLDNQRQTK